jgi:hypothetical protein
MTSCTAAKLTVKVWYIRILLAVEVCDPCTCSASHAQSEMRMIRCDFELQKLTRNVSKISIIVDLKEWNRGL